jgi:hypothetical protein
LIFKPGKKDRAVELLINIELPFKNKQKEKRAAELIMPTRNSLSK